MVIKLWNILKTHGAWLPPTLKGKEPQHRSHFVALATIAFCPNVTVGLLVASLCANVKWVSVFSSSCPLLYVWTWWSIKKCLCFFFLNKSLESKACSRMPFTCSTFRIIQVFLVLLSFLYLWYIYFTCTLQKLCLLHSWTELDFSYASCYSVQPGRLMCHLHSL